MGLDPKFTLEDVVYGHCSVADACMSIPGGPDVLAASSGSSDMVDIGNARRQMLVEELIAFAADYDFLIIDVGAGIGKSVTTFLSAAPEVAVVVANEPTSVMDAYSLIKVLSQQADPPSLMLVVNMVQSLEEGELLAGRLNGIARRFIRRDIPLARIVLYDPIVGDAIRARTPVVRYAEKAAPARCVEEIARFLIRNLQPGEAGKRTTQRLFDQMANTGIYPKGASEA
jgi:flagellar biosynthesis protein FlhG